MTKSASPSPFQIPALAIDLGYFSVKVAYGKKNGAVQCLSFESLAPRVSGPLDKDPGARPLDAVTIAIGDVSYFVGPDARSRTTGNEVREITDDYSRSNEYLALFKGALYQAAKEVLRDHPGLTRLEIVQLVCGLPVSTLPTHSSVVRELATGEHVLPPIPGTRGEPLTVVVKKTSVVAQPRGALVHFGAQHEAKDLLAHHNLVVDLGGGTFDWFSADNNKPNYQRCGSHKSGMLAIAHAVSEMISPGLREDVAAIKRLDTAIRTLAPTVRLKGEDLPLAQYESTIEVMLDEGISKMLANLKRWDSVDNILVTGGGGQRLQKVLEQRLEGSKIPVLNDKEPIFSNVRGFYLIAEWLLHGKA